MDITSAQLAAPLSDSTRKERRALLLMTIIILAIEYAHVLPTKVEQLGIAIQPAQRDVLLWLLVGVQSFFVLEFFFSARAELLVWHWRVFDVMNAAGRRLRDYISNFRQFERDVNQAFLSLKHFPDVLRDVEPLLAPTIIKDIGMKASFLAYSLENAARFSDQLPDAARLNRTARLFLDRRHEAPRTETEARVRLAHVCVEVNRLKDALPLRRMRSGRFIDRLRLRRRFRKLVELRRRELDEREALVDAHPTLLVSRVRSLLRALENRYFDRLPGAEEVSADILREVEVLDRFFLDLPWRTAAEPTRPYRRIQFDIEHLPKVMYGFAPDRSPSLDIIRGEHHAFTEAATKLAASAERTLRRFRVKAFIDGRLPVIIGAVGAYSVFLRLVVRALV